MQKLCVTNHAVVTSTSGSMSVKALPDVSMVKIANFCNYFGKIDTKEHSDVEFDTKRSFEFEKGDFRSEIEDTRMFFSKMLSYTETRARIQGENWNFTRRLKIFKRTTKVPGSDFPNRYEYKALLFDPTAGKNTYDLALYELSAKENLETGLFFNAFHDKFCQAICEEATNHLAFCLKTKLERIASADFGRGYLRAKKVATMNLDNYTADLESTDDENDKTDKPVVRKRMSFDTDETLEGLTQPNPLIEDKLDVEEMRDSMFSTNTLDRKNGEIQNVRTKPYVDNTWMLPDMPTHEQSTQVSKH